MSTTRRFIISITVIVCTAAAIYEGRQAVQLREQVQSLQQERAALAEQTRQLQKERDDTTNRLALMATEIAKSSSNDVEVLKLRGEVTRLRDAATPKVAKPQMSASEAAEVATFEQMAKKTKEATSELAFDGLLSQMKQRLHITSDQEGAIRDLLKADPVPRLKKHEAELLALLSPDQQAAYEEFKHETQSDKERLSVHQAVLDVLVNLQSNVGLDQEQQDKALAALLEYGQRKVTYDGNENQSHDSSAYMAAEENLARLTLNAMKGILTDEQMAIYQKYEEQMLQAKGLLLYSQQK